MKPSRVVGDRKAKRRECGGPMIMIMLITPADVLLRSPPAFISVDCHPGAQV